jgi:hypothetical protein
MAEPEHVAIAQQGAEALQRWRTAHPQERLELASPVHGPNIA